MINCTDCKLCKSRTKIVPGKGSIDANTMIVGEAPGQQEDYEGIPFVGKSGELLTHMLNRADLSRKEVFITNLVKCRPPENRDPHKEEIDECSKYLSEQIEILQPEKVIAVGRHAGQNLTGKRESLGHLIEEGPHKLKEELQYEGGTTKVVPIYHPSYLLRNGKPEHLISEMVGKLKEEDESDIYEDCNKFLNT